MRLPINARTRSELQGAFDDDDTQEESANALNPDLMTNMTAQVRSTLRLEPRLPPNVCFFLVVKQ